MTDDARWAAVQARDARFDGRFVYAVDSTGVYCRPSCAARRPRRVNVRFLAGPEAAEAAGFRACRRCRPRERLAPQLALAQRAARWIEAHAGEPVTLAALGSDLGVGPSHLQRIFARATGLTPRQYAAACRLARLKARLRAGDDVTTALYAAGYGSSSRLYEQARARLGMTPGEYRRGGRGLRIRYATAGCPLGRLLVGATADGVCAVGLGDTDGALEAFLRREYPAAEVTRDDVAVRPWIEALLDRLDGGAPDVELPLDLRGTAFQLQVWSALQAIPRGATRSYGEIAGAMGKPTAARAVARACATNPAALAVPCHRAVRHDGDVGGYRWGSERKRALLEREGPSK